MPKSRTYFECLNYMIMSKSHSIMLIVLYCIVLTQKFKWLKSNFFKYDII